MQRDCTVYKSVDLISKRWTLLILLELYRGNTKKKRYSEVKKKIPGITPKILSVRLKELTKNGLLNKQIDANSIPIKSEYSLTKKGTEFIEIIKSIKTWALKNNIENEVCQKMNCKECNL